MITARHASEAGRPVSPTDEREATTLPRLGRARHAQAVGAAWYRGRAELRRRWSSLVALALVAGLAAGVAMGLAAAARRTESVYDRFLERQRAADVFMASDDFPELLDRAAKLPQVEEYSFGSGFSDNSGSDLGLDAMRD